MYKRQYLYRGVSDIKHFLVPKIVRTKLNSKKNSKVVTEEIASLRKERMREYLTIRLPAYGFEFSDSDRKLRLWKELFIAQHYGVPTPLLDFSRNPLVGLFFACISNPQKDGALHAVCIKPQIVESKEDFKPKAKDYNIASFDLISSGEDGFSPYDLDRPLFIVPSQFDTRILTQNSVFCCFPTQKLTTKLQDQLIPKSSSKKPQSGQMNHMVEWKIPKRKKERLLIDLNRIGVNHATIYNDISGFGEFATWKIQNIE